METAGNAALATTVGELPLKKKKNRKLQRHKPSSSAADNQLKQANKESSVEAKEEKTATVDTTEDGEVEEDKKPAAVQSVEPNELAQLGTEERDSLLLEKLFQRVKNTKWWKEAQQTWLKVELQGNGCVLACQPQSSLS